MIELKWKCQYSRKYSLCYGNTYLVTRNTLFPLVVLICTLIVLVYSLMVLVCPFVCLLVVLVSLRLVSVCPLVVLVCPFVVLLILFVGLFITDLLKNPSLQTWLTYLTFAAFDMLYKHAQARLVWSKLTINCLATI